jgi:tetratricopeptide (TPR) repeat protein
MRKSWRRALLVASIAIVVVAGWRIVSLAMAEFLADTDPARALEWRSDHPRALLGLAERRLIQGRLDEAETLAKRMAAADPLDGRAYRVLGNIAGLRGDRKHQFAMMNLAALHAPRDIPARAWAAQIALDRHDAASAVRHYDRMIRVAPERMPVVFKVLIGIAGIPEGRDALVKILATNPPWRPEFLRDAAAGVEHPADLMALFGGLRVNGGLGPQESSAYLGRLVNDHLWNEAFVAWAGGLSAEQLANVTAPMDGDFESQSPARGPFDWQIAQRGGVETSIQGLPDGPGHALRVDFEGQRSDFRDVRQLLLLPSAAGYRLEWRSRLDGLETARGLRWTIVCAEGNTGKILATPPVTGSRPWHSAVAEFDVPAGCPAQWLTLEIDARIAAETQARGTAWFDDVRIISPRGRE